MSPVIAVAVLFFCVLLLATTGEAQDVKYEVAKIKKEIKSAQDKKHKLLTEEEAIKTTCNGNISKLNVDQSGLSAEIHAQMMKAKALLVNLTGAKTEDGKLTKNVAKKTESLERLILLSNLWKEDLELFKKRRTDGSYKKCLELVNKVLKGAAKSKTINSDELLLLENELRQLKTELSFITSENEILIAEKKSLKERCELKIKDFQNFLNSGTKDLDSAKKLVKRFEDELLALDKNISDKNKTISVLVGKIAKENELLGKISEDNISYREDKACYRQLEHDVLRKSQ